MSSTVRRDRLRTIAVRGIQARVSVRPPSGRFIDEPPLLLCNGIGVSLEALQPLVDALDPDRGVIRFDVPGVGGSPTGVLPAGIPLLAWIVMIRMTPKIQETTVALAVLYTVFPVVLAAGALWAWRHPDRGIQDRVAGTWVVPR